PPEHADSPSPPTRTYANRAVERTTAGISSDLELRRAEAASLPEEIVHRRRGCGVVEIGRESHRVLGGPKERRVVVARRDRRTRPDVRPDREQPDLAAEPLLAARPAVAAPGVVAARVRLVERDDQQPVVRVQV